MERGHGGSRPAPGRGKRRGKEAPSRAWRELLHGSGEREPRAREARGGRGEARKEAKRGCNPVQRRVRGVPARGEGSGGGRPHLLSFNTSSSSAQLSHIVH